MLARVAMPAVRQKRSKRAPTSCQASSMVATGTTAAVVGSFMALLSFVDSAPRAYRLKVGNACPPISTSTGTSPIDHACRIITTAGVSLPVFFTGLLLVYVLYFRLGWAPAPIGRLDVFSSAPPYFTGFYLIDSLLAGDFELFRAALSQLILPAMTLGIFSLAPITRMTRASMLAVLASDFVRTARANGLSGRTVILTYAFRNAMLPVITTLGMVFSFLLGANVLVEKVFAWPGIGSFAVEALIASDFAPVQGFVLTMAVLYVTLNLIIDILYGVVDPRVRLEA